MKKKSAETETGAPRKSFILYTDLLSVISDWEPGDIGILLKAILCYVSGLELPPMKGEVTSAFRFIKNQLDRDHEAYLAALERKREGKAD